MVDKCLGIGYDQSRKGGSHEPDHWQPAGRRPHRHRPRRDLRRGRPRRQRPGVRVTHQRRSRARGHRRLMTTNALGQSP